MAGVLLAVNPLFLFSSLSPIQLCVCVALAIAMAAIMWTDWRDYRIPDVLSLPLIPAGLLASGHFVDRSSGVLVEPSHVLGAVLGAGLFWAVRAGYSRVRGQIGLGLGDVKLAGAGGAWVGAYGFPHVMLLSTLSALALVCVLMLAGRNISPQTRLPFGVFLAPAIWLVWLNQQLA